MAVLWLHTASLLVLMVMSCPGSQAMSSQHLCGSHLVSALHLVCGDRGFRFMVRTDDNPMQHFSPPSAGRAAPVGGEDELPEFASKDQMEMMVKRGIVEQCCQRPCNIFDLESYCN
ncbi:insulin-like [Toxotes jaculatrix]|uniref:insulin-like n=1 Tax=Toxotes jaculatrix TaxID=941984 RepID=UPI001B3AB16C|nr:insulin-like [Toxotes jaculatrix]